MGATLGVRNATSDTASVRAFSLSIHRSTGYYPRWKGDSELADWRCASTRLNATLALPVPVLFTLYCSYLDLHSSCVAAHTQKHGSSNATLVPVDH